MNAAKKKKEITNVFYSDTVELKGRSKKIKVNPPDRLDKAVTYTVHFSSIEKLLEFDKKVTEIFKGIEAT